MNEEAVTKMSLGIGWKRLMGNYKTELFNNFFHTENSRKKLIKIFNNHLLLIHFRFTTVAFICY